MRKAEKLQRLAILERLRELRSPRFRCFGWLDCDGYHAYNSNPEEGD